MGSRIYNSLLERKKKGLKSFAILIDPDHSFNSGKIKKTVDLACQCRVDYFFVGGSYFLENNIEKCISVIKNTCPIPVILFPGHITHVNLNADAILFLSLISGRNPEYLIGQHVIAAPGLKAKGIEVIPTGYIILDGGRPSTATYITFTTPIPQDQTALVSATALAGEMLGMKLIYLEAGSGALNPVSAQVIQNVTQTLNLPIIVGGGIDTPAKAKKALVSGADLIVVGNKIADSPEFIKEIAGVIEKLNKH